jgi:hypothetical protein
MIKNDCNTAARIRLYLEKAKRETPLSRAKKQLVYVHIPE